jgi:1,4-alpha-glucan branching enzyme
VTHARPRLGATPSHDGSDTTFAVWAPSAGRVEVVLEDPDAAAPLAPSGDGVFAGAVAGAGPGRR